MSKKPKTSLDVDTGVDLALGRIDEMEALSILEGIGCEKPTPDQVHVITRSWTSLCLPSANRNPRGVHLIKGPRIVGCDHAS